MGGLIFAALFPFAPLGAAAAVAYSLAHPPLSWMTGVGRWEVHTIFSALGAALSLWVVLGPTLALGLTLARGAGLRSAASGAISVGLVVFAGLSLLAGSMANGGLASPGLVEETLGWTSVLALPSALGAVWTAACVAAAQRWRARIVRRGLAPGRDAP